MNGSESRGAMTAQQLGTRIHKLLLKVADSKTSNISNAFARMLITELGDLKVVADDADALSAHNTAQVTQERDDARQRLADYESADLQIADIHAKELADHEKEVAELRAALEVKEKERESALSTRKHTQDWYAAHYGKLEDWARKRLPDPWRNEFFHCVANGTWGHDDLGEPYMSQVGRIVPSGYFKMDSAAEQLLRDQTIRAENAEAELSRLRSQGAGPWRTDEPPQEESILALIEYQISSKPAEEHIVCMLRDDNLVDEAGDDIGWTKEVIRKWMPLSSVAEGAGQSREVALRDWSMGRTFTTSTAKEVCGAFVAGYDAAIRGLASPPESQP